MCRFDDTGSAQGRERCLSLFRWQRDKQSTAGLWIVQNRAQSIGEISGSPSLHCDLAFGRALIACKDAGPNASCEGVLSTVKQRES